MCKLLFRKAQKFTEKLLIMYLSNYCSINKWLIFLLKHFGVPPNALPI